MTWSEWLSVAGNLAAVLTAIVAALAYGRYELNRYRQLKRLEALLKPKDGKEFGGMPVVHAAAQLGMTEADVLDASFRSKKIKRIIPYRFVGEPDRIVLRYYKE